jgi:hypothetical protein
MKEDKEKQNKEAEMNMKRIEQWKEEQMNVRRDKVGPG